MAVRGEQLDTSALSETPAAVTHTVGRSPRNVEPQMAYTATMRLPAPVP